MTSSDKKLLLRARGVTKSFPSKPNPVLLITNALLGAKLPYQSKTVLNGIDLDVFAGETIGIIGRNGAGKSTLLSIMGGVLPANGGTVERHCPIAVLLGIGTGFDLNMTGRENVGVYWLMNGMSKEDIARKMPLAEAFADIGDYFDDMAKTYSSGMYARVAFAAAIHLDADLMIIDETLAVGDADFRMKCLSALQRMQSEGRSFLLVSHSDGMITTFCNRAIVLDEAAKVYDGTPFGAVTVYKELRIKHESERARQRNLKSDVVVAAASVNGSDKPVELSSVQFMDQANGETYEGRRAKLVVSLRAHARIERPQIGILIRNQQGTAIAGTVLGEENEPDLEPLLPDETRVVSLEFDDVLVQGAYYVSVLVSRVDGEMRDPVGYFDNCFRFDIGGGRSAHGIVDINFRSSVERILPASH